MKKLFVYIILVILSMPVCAATVIGNWENGSSDGWIDWIEWGNGQSITSPLNASKYSFSTIGATSGTESLKVTQSGWGQTLAIKLQNNGFVDDFLANTIFQIDVTYPATNAAGWQEIWEVALNAAWYGWNPLSDDPVPTSHVDYGPDGGPQKTFTLSFDYSSALSKIGSNPGYVEFILCTNSDAGHGVFYFDNARLVNANEIVPEPATIAFLGLGLVLFRKRGN
ncbi:MAG: PEP-CTERM sorting domain-containing protein [Sedimentisphaerales bacterium]